MKKKIIEFSDYLIKGIYAGLMIGIAGTVYLASKFLSVVLSKMILLSPNIWLKIVKSSLAER